MKIKKVVVRNFKSLTDVNGDGFADVNFIHGFNNSGKSNFLKFIELLFMSKSIESKESYSEGGLTKTRRKVEENTPFWKGMIYDMPFIFRNDERKQPIDFEVHIEILNSVFPNEAELKKLELLSKHESTRLIVIGKIEERNPTDSEIVLTEAKLGSIAIFSNSAGVAGAGQYFPTISTSPKPDSSIVDDILNLLNDSVLLVGCDRFFEKEIQVGVNGDFSSKNFKSWLFDQYIDSDKHRNFLTLLSFIKSFNITSKAKSEMAENLANFPLQYATVDFTKFGDELEIMLDGKNGRFPLKNFGTGIQQIFYLLTRIFSSSSKIILIEELELIPPHLTRT